MVEMSSADVPDGLIEPFAAAIERHVAAVGPRVVPYREIAPIVLAAVLPLYGQQVRAGIVAELEAHAADCTAHDLPGEAASFEAAARYLSSDPEGDGDDE